MRTANKLGSVADLESSDAVDCRDTGIAPRGRCLRTTDEPIASAPDESLSSTTLAPPAAPADSPTSTSTATSLREPTTTAATPPPPESATGFDWPAVNGPPAWASVPLGLPGATHVRVTHGPLGFLSINNVGRGAVVRTSVDGSIWKETAVLTGPGGEEQVAVADLLVTDREYLVVGETWTNTHTGSETLHDVLWRSNRRRHVRDHATQ